MSSRRQTRSSGGAGVAGTYGPSEAVKHDSSGNAQDPSDPRPHITRSSGGAGVDGTYGPDSTLNNSEDSAGSHQATRSNQQQSEPQGSQRRTDPEGTSPAKESQQGNAASEEGLPDPMVAADDGSQPHEASAGLQGSMMVGTEAGSPRSKL